LFRNPLAGPWALGLTAGAQLGVALVAVAGAVAGSAGLAVALERLGVIADLSLAAGAFGGATAVLVGVVALSRRVNAVTLLIAGLMFGFLAQGLVGVLLHFTTESQIEVFENWSDGSFGGVTADKLTVLAPAVALGLLLIGLSIKPLNALLLGERYARSLGVRIERARNTALFAVVCLAGSVTAYCGPILFLDLAVPHLCRGLFRTTDHRILVPAVALVGSTVALAADLIVHLPWRQHFLHLNAVNALIGAPVVLWVLLRRRSRHA
ncbi:MAG: iron chelate uptake ABC transporter family permease subunit, partial [Acidobacteriota bacterium]